MERTTTKVDGGVSDEGQGVTKFDTSANVAPQRREPAAHQRKLTGVLVTFKWRSQGELFPPYEGRTGTHVVPEAVVPQSRNTIAPRSGRLPK